MTPPDLLVRPATPDDALDVARVHLVSRASAAMPPGIHPDHDVRAFLAARLAVDEVWVAEVDAELVGYVRFTPTWLDDLYVVPSAAGSGVGSALLDVVKALRPQGFGLWVFEMNLPARGFYERHGFVEVLRTDGTGNEERCPDVQMEWPGE